MDQQRITFRRRRGMSEGASGQAQQGVAAPVSPMRRLLRRVVRRLAALLALLILFYATSLHGVSLRTLVLAGILILCLYWIFKNHITD